MVKVFLAKRGTECCPTLATNVCAGLRTLQMVSCTKSAIAANTPVVRSEAEHTGGCNPRKRCGATCEAKLRHNVMRVAEGGNYKEEILINR